MSHRVSQMSLIREGYFLRSFAQGFGGRSWTLTEAFFASTEIITFHYYTVNVVSFSN
jgi:hypothetical protein